MKRLLKWLCNTLDFDVQRRKLDMEILWPSCVANARDLDHAKAAFAVHAFSDEAWTCLGHDEIYRIIDGLKP